MLLVIDPLQEAGVFTYQRWLRLGAAQFSPVFWLELYLLELIATYLGSSLENDRLLIGASAVGECAHCLGGFIIKSCQHLVQTVVAECFQEGFASYISIFVTAGLHIEGNVHVRPREAFERVKLKCSILS